MFFNIFPVVFKKKVSLHFISFLWLYWCVCKGDGIDSSSAALTAAGDDLPRKDHSEERIYAWLGWNGNDVRYFWRLEGEAEKRWYQRLEKCSFDERIFSGYETYGEESPLYGVMFEGLRICHHITGEVDLLVYLTSQSCTRSSPTWIRMMISRSTTIFLDKYSRHFWCHLWWRTEEFLV